MGTSRRSPGPQNQSQQQQQGFQPVGASPYPVGQQGALIKDNYQLNVAPSKIPSKPSPEPHKPLRSQTQPQGPNLSSAKPSPPPSNIAPSSGQATPRRRDKKEKDKGKEEDIVKRLQQICTDADPTKLYRSLVRIGQGASGGVYTAYQVGTNVCVAIKQMDLEKQPKTDLIINEILVMRSSRHPNIVYYIDSFLRRNELWVVMEYMEGGSLTDVVTANLMTEGQIAAVSQETCRGLEHLHRHGVIHRDIKSDNVLLSLTGDVKLSKSICLFAWRAVTLT